MTPDTLQVLPATFTSMALNTAYKSTLLGPPDRRGSCNSCEIFWAIWSIARSLFREREEVTFVKWLTCWAMLVWQVSSNSSYASMFTFRVILLEKVWTPLSNLSHNKRFFGCFHLIMVQFLFVNINSELDYLACSTLQLSNHISSEAMHNMPAHQLPHHYLYFFGHVIHALQTSMY